MSASNRGSTRKAFDFYATPIEVIQNLLNNIDLNKYGDNVLEPSAGNGNFCRVIQNHYPHKNITAFEIREEELESLLQCSNTVVIGDFLYMDTNIKYDIIIGNPPYSKAMEFVVQSLKFLKDNGVLIFLLRTAFLESKARYNFWKENPINGLYTLSKGPSFTGHGTDATSYSWFIWDRSTKHQCIKVI